jgi:hypothetical protein
MFKTSPAQRAAVRRSKQKRRAGQSPEEKSREREYSKTYHRKNANRLNEKRRARRNRHGKKEEMPEREFSERYAGMSTVSFASVFQDRTLWKGPGMQKEMRLAAQADAIIKKAAEAKRTAAPAIAQPAIAEAPIGEPAEETRTNAQIVADFSIKGVPR